MDNWKLDNWISVYDQTPDDGQQVIIYTPTTHWVGPMWYKSGFFTTEEDSPLPTKVHVTLWQPLPEPPQSNQIGAIIEDLQELIDTLKNDVERDIFYDARDHGDVDAQLIIDNVINAPRDFQLVLDKLKRLVGDGLKGES